MLLLGSGRIVVSLLLPSLEMVTWKLSSDSERPLGVISGFSISDFNLGCGLFFV